MSEGERDREMLKAKMGWVTFHLCVAEVWYVRKIWSQQLYQSYFHNTGKKKKILPWSLELVQKC